MVQELGETTSEMVKRDNEDVEKILNERPKGHYWIVIHHKPTRMKMNTGQGVVMRLVKAYDTKPKDLLGTIVLEVKDGEVINQEVTPHDIPIDWATVSKHLGHSEDPFVVKKPGLAQNYIYN